MGGRFVCFAWFAPAQLSEKMKRSPLRGLSRVFLEWQLPRGSSSRFFSGSAHDASSILDVVKTLTLDEHHPRLMKDAQVGPALGSDGSEEDGGRSWVHPGLQLAETASRGREWVVTGEVVGRRAFLKPLAH